MQTNRRQFLRHLQRAAFFSAAAGLALAQPADAFLSMAVAKPAVHEFGFGPRESVNQKFTVYLKPVETLRLRKLQTVHVLVLDATGRPVEGARIAVDGGMPEHGHGLPTQPQEPRSLGGGMYAIDGLRFSMGGWWELKLSIEAPAASDRVSFNLSL